MEPRQVEVYARSRIDIIEAHVAPLHAKLVREKEKVAKRGAAAVASMVLAFGMEAADNDFLTVASIGSFAVFTMSAALRHVHVVEPLDQAISERIRSAERIASDVGIPFTTNYVHPEDRRVAQVMAKLRPGFLRSRQA